MNHRWRHEDAAPSRYNHGVEPAMATRGRRRPRFEPSMATRGRRRTQLANSAQGAGRPRITTPSQNRKKGRGWHTNREGGRAILVSHLAISCRDPNRFEPAIATRGGRRTQRANSEQAAGRLRVATRGGRTLKVLCAVLLRCCAVLCCCAVLHCCVSVRPPHRVTTLSCYPQ